MLKFSTLSRISKSKPHLTKVRNQNWISHQATFQHVKESTYDKNPYTDIHYQPIWPRDHSDEYGSHMRVMPPPEISDPLIRRYEDILSETENPFNLNGKITINDMVESKMHMGHASSRRHIQMNDSVFGERFGMDIIDLEAVRPRFELAMKILGSVAYRKGLICFVCEQPRHRYKVQELARKFNQYTLDSTHLGFVSGFNDFFKTGQKMPDLFFFFGVQNFQHSKPNELLDYAHRVHGLTMGICDTDVNPTQIDYRIPGNDDSEESIDYYLKIIDYTIREAYKLRLKIDKQIEPGSIPDQKLIPRTSVKVFEDEDGNKKDTTTTIKSLFV